MRNSPPEHYSILAILLHWVTAIVVFALFAVGYWMVDLNYYSEWYRTAPYWHKSVGLLLALLTIARCLYKLQSSVPKPLGSKFEALAAKSAHLMLYLLLFCLFISGYLISTADGRGIDIFNWVTIPSAGELINDQEDVAGLVHEYTAYVLMGLVVIHALAALKHHFIDKDATLRRMFKSQKLI